MCLSAPAGGAIEQGNGAAAAQADSSAERRSEEGGERPLKKQRTQQRREQDLANLKKRRAEAETWAEQLRRSGRFTADHVRDNNMTAVQLEALCKLLRVQSGGTVQQRKDRLVQHLSASAAAGPPAAAAQAGTS